MNKVVSFYANYMNGQPQVKLVEVDDRPRSTGEFVTLSNGRRVVLRGRRRVARPDPGKAYYEFRYR